MSKKWYISAVIGIILCIFSIIFVYNTTKKDPIYMPVEEVRVSVLKDNPVSKDSAAFASEHLLSYEESFVENTRLKNPIKYELPEYNPVNEDSTEDIPEIKKGQYTGTKSYEYASVISNKSSRAYQMKILADTEDGFLKYDDRFLVAIGTHFNAPVGTYINIELENGTNIPAIVGDIKADKHTDENNVYSMTCICATEFIVDNSFKSKTGDVSLINPDWQSKVTSITTYEYNCLN